MPESLHPTERFSDRVADYVCYRPGYPPELLECLRREGVDIARRTVAKYREALRIPSSVQRKREKAVPA